MCAWNYQRPAGAKYDVAICIPTRGYVSQKFAHGLLQLEKPANYLVNWQHGHQIDTARNVQVSLALQREAKRVLFLDSDVIPPPDGLSALIVVDMPIVSGVYFSRAPPYHVMAKIGSTPIPRDRVGVPGMAEVTDVGMGFCLVDIRVFHRIGAALPWLCLQDHTDDAKKTVVKVTYPEALAQNFACPYCKNPLIAPFFQTTLGFADADPMSEDYFFCKRARDTGFPVMVKLDVVCDHELDDVTINNAGLNTGTKVIGT